MEGGNSLKLCSATVKTKKKYEPLKFQGKNKIK